MYSGTERIQSPENFGISGWFFLVRRWTHAVLAPSTSSVVFGAFDIVMLYFRTFLSNGRPLNATSVSSVYKPYFGFQTCQLPGPLESPELYVPIPRERNIPNAPDRPPNVYGSHRSTFRVQRCRRFEIRWQHCVVPIHAQHRRNPFQVSVVI